MRVDGEETGVDTSEPNSKMGRQGVENLDSLPKDALAKKR